MDGLICFESSFFYICEALNQTKRIIAYTSIMFEIDKSGATVNPLRKDRALALAATFNLCELIDDFTTSGFHQRANLLLLRFDAQPAIALLLCRNAEVGDELLSHYQRG